MVYGDLISILALAFRSAHEGLFTLPPKAAAFVSRAAGSSTTATDGRQPSSLFAAAVADKELSYKR